MRRVVPTIAVLVLVTAACTAVDEGPTSDAAVGERADAAGGEDAGATADEDPQDPVAEPDGSAGAGDVEAAAPRTTTAGTGTGPREPIRAESDGCEEGDFHWSQPGCQPAHSIDLDEIISGGPPPDGIPPIDDPVYESVEDAATWLDDASPVMVVDVAGDVRAYPLAILTWHEIVNDVVGGVPLVVTYCPLCNSALVFERTVAGPEGDELLDFGTSGRLYLSNLVMYDRQHRNLWTQFEGEAVVGERFLGTQLTRVPAWLFGFGELSELHPDAQVLSRETGFTRDYGRNPYTGYDQEERNPFLFRGELDERFPPMTRMVGLDAAQPVAVLLDVLEERRAVTVPLDEGEIVVVWAPGQASALDTPAIDDGREVGQTAAFEAELDGEAVTLEPGDDDGRFVDSISGSTFDLRGRALDGPLAGQQLTPVPHDDTFWFVWVAFRPDTAVVTS
jgi:hypothetical protein